MSKNIIETVVGLIVLAIAAGFIIIAYESGSIHSKNVDGYKVTAQFSRIDGINVGSAVKLSGVNVGKVLSITLDPKTYNAIAEIIIDNKYKLPQDSSAEIIGDGLLGQKYVALAPGADDVYLEEGSRIEFTQPSISFESLIAKFIFGSTDNKKPKENTNSPGETNVNNPS